MSDKMRIYRGQSQSNVTFAIPHIPPISVFLPLASPRRVTGVWPACSAPVTDCTSCQLELLRSHISALISCLLLLITLLSPLCYDTRDSTPRLSCLRCLQGKVKACLKQWISVQIQSSTVSLLYNFTCSLLVSPKMF